MEAGKIVLLSLLIFCHQTWSASPDTITASQSITDGSLLISKGGRFALGFFTPGRSNHRYLGIWYNEIPEQTVVWVANRNNPITGTSGILSFGGSGNLSLYSSSEEKHPLWSAKGANGPCVAQLLDSGNLVLMDGSNTRMTTMWESFAYPTDTRLPGMKIGLNRRTGLSHVLTSWRSADDPGAGNFTFELMPSGPPQFYLYQGTYLYWRSGPGPWGNTTSYNVFFVDNEDGIYYSTTLLNSSLLRRVVIDSSGKLKSMSWDEDDRQWKVFYSFPKGKCDFYGSCGPNSICDPSVLFTYDCSCLPGYEPTLLEKWQLRDGSSGCVRKRLESSSLCGSGEGFVRVENMKIPDTSTAIWMDLGTNKLKCEEECRKNCACSAYATNYIDGKGTGCWIWHGKLMDTVHLSADACELYVRVDAIELADYLKESNGLLELKIRIIVPSIVSVWLVMLLLAYLWIRKWKKRRVKNRRIRNLFHPSDGSNYLVDSLAPREVKRSTIYPELPFFSLSTIHDATDSFSSASKIGQGGFGSVYKGKLSNGQEIAVKRLAKHSSEGLEQFKNEVLLIAKLQHRNLVKLHGCCIEEDEQILIYEYLPCNSLDSVLFVDGDKRSFLDWRKRFNIIVGIARGILYLHQDSRFRIIHRDLKPSNILLDAKLNPKISDFGMARILDSDQIDGKTSRVSGTYGYMSPEYVIFGRYSVKLDVFSFGVTLLETVTGKKINGFFHEDRSLSLISHVWELWQAGRATEVIDSSMSVEDLNEVLRCIQIGLLCVEENAVDRPDMLTVVLMLSSDTTPVPSPQKPAFVVCMKPKPLLTEEQACSINEMSFSGILSR